MKFNTSEIEVEVLLEGFSSKQNFPEEVIRGQVHFMAQPGSEFQITVQANGSCFDKLSASQKIFVGIKLGGKCVGSIYGLKNGQKVLVYGWDVPGGKALFKTAIPQISENDEARPENSARVNQVEVDVCKYHIYPTKARDMPVQSLHFDKGTGVKGENKKFFHQPSMVLEAGKICGPPRGPNHHHIVLDKELARFSGVIERPSIVELRAKEANPKWNLNLQNIVQVQLTAFHLSSFLIRLS